MIQRARALLFARESGQAVILAAVTLPMLLLFMGLAVYGGQLYSKHQSIQSAADMAAIVGAQDLPCSTVAGDAKCVTAKTDACAYAVKNGFSCDASTTPAANVSFASVPPYTCSPYDFMDYGNAATNNKCKSATAATYYDFIEVQLVSSVIKIPIFNKSITMTAHAVAKRANSTAKGMAFVCLNNDGSSNPCINLQNSNSTQIQGGVVANGNISNTSSTKADACYGGWFASGTVSGVTTGTTNSLIPLDCTATTGTPFTEQHVPPITDPYYGSVAPTSAMWSNSGSTCTECGQGGWWLDLNDTTTTPTAGNPYPGWHQVVPNANETPLQAQQDYSGGVLASNSGCTSDGTSKSYDIEMFPGVYNTMPNGNIYCIFMNPGVYTFLHGVDLDPADNLDPTKKNASEHVGITCVWGSPACQNKDQGACDNKNNMPKTGTTYNLNAWFYECSPWGLWDSAAKDKAGLRPPSLPTAAPTWYNTSTSLWTDVPLNGVTLYFPQNNDTACSVTTPVVPCGDLSTPDGASTGDFLAAPNPCPGTGSTFTAATSAGARNGSVSWSAGNSSAYYSYATTDLPYVHFGSGVNALAPNQSYANNGHPYSLIYPNDDVTIQGECNLPYVEWPNAMPAPQHINFLIYEAGHGSNLFFGTDDFDWQGVFYAPQSSLYFTGKSGSEGSSGSGAEGPPWLQGQVVVNNANFFGASAVQIEYQECTTTALDCLAGNSLQLVQ